MDRHTILVLALPLLIGAVLLVLAGSAPVDDAYISLRTAHNLTSGSGLVFNPGERVLGVSNFLWTLMLALADFALPVQWMPAAASVLAGFFLLLGALFFGLRLVDEGWSRFGIFLAVLLIVSNHRLLEYCAGGMETGLLVSVAGLSVFLLRRHERAAIVVAGLLPLVRPEAFVLWPALWLTAPEAKRLLRLKPILLLLLPGLLFAAFAWLVFGSPFPASVTAKAVLARSSLPDAIRALLDFFACFGLGEKLIQLLAQLGVAVPILWGLALNLGMLLIGALAMRRIPIGRFGVVGLLLYLGLFTVGRPILLGWHLAGAELTFVVVYAAVVELVWRRASEQRMPLRAGVAAVVVLLLVAGQATHLRWGQDHPKDRARLTSTRHVNRVREFFYTQIGRQLAQHDPQKPVLAATEIGALGWSYGGPILDVFGLVSPEVLPYYRAEPEPHFVPELIDDLQPAFFVTIDSIDLGLLETQPVQSDYRRLLSIPVTFYGGRQLVVLERLSP